MIWLKKNNFASNEENKILVWSWRFEQDSVLDI